MGKLFEDLCRAALEEERIFAVVAERATDVFGAANVTHIDFYPEETQLDVWLNCHISPNYGQLEIIWELGAKRLKLHVLQAVTYFYAGGPVEGKVIRQ